MRQRNHCSSLKGIPKMKLQGSGSSTPKSLQSQNRPRPENRLSISRLGVVHGQLPSLANSGPASSDGPYATLGASRTGSALKPAPRPGSGTWWNRLLEQFHSQPWGAERPADDKGHHCLSQHRPAHHMQIMRCSAEVLPWPNVADANPAFIEACPVRPRLA
jgi:hypothetical protein